MLLQEQNMPVVILSWAYTVIQVAFDVGLFPLSGFNKLAAV